ncbi:hypothetical protein G7Z17_g13319 [Cylindrodendrum hubeiense]|uniref:Zn(2)-C6 fungal-type domain-containing protein n=1 Tax=Cylindrodendrum hubeiense TaxID=595255 RepID=A0A9P5H074_9HYPO|nr:hypothetical protein G7Z17_g13319 [Cylindrodendrum hubeiense]
MRISLALRVCELCAGDLNDDDDDIDNRRAPQLAAAPHRLLLLRLLSRTAGSLSASSPPAVRPAPSVLSSRYSPLRRRRPSFPPAGTMSSSFEKSVKGATKIKNAPPKTKYIEHILVATHSGEAGIGEVFRALQNRLRDSTWTVVFKSLITVHLMIREGSPDVTLAFLSTHRNMLAISSFTDAQIQGRNIRHYALYLTERGRAYKDTKTDWVRAPESRLEKMSVEKGLLRETEVVQHQLSALLKCDVMESEPENEITITVFRLLVLDLLALFQVLNQGLIAILGHFFEMSKVDAERAMAVYRTFTRQTDQVVQYLGVARQYEHHTRVEVPKLKHAPVNLGKQLEEYLTDPDFEVHRRQYLAEQDVKKTGGSSSSSKMFTSSKKKDSDFPEPASNNPFPSASSSKAPQLPELKPHANKGPDPDLIDFFDSIEQNQTPLQINPQQQPQQQMNAAPFQPQPTGMTFQSNGFAPQPTGFAANSPFQPQPTGFVQQPQAQPQQLLPNFTGAGFGGFTQSFQPSSLAPIPQDSVASFPTGAVGAPQVQNSQPQGLMPMATGSTNPFRQSMLMAQQTGLPTTAMSTSASTPALGANPNRQSTNPFARSPQQNASPFPPAANSPYQQQPQGHQSPGSASVGDNSAQSVSASNANKRKSIDDSASKQTRSKRNRYISIACNECKRRKIKCNGETPCQRCGNLNLACLYAPNCCSNNFKDSDDFRHVTSQIGRLQEEVGWLHQTVKALQSDPGRMASLGDRALPMGTSTVAPSPSQSSSSLNRDALHSKYGAFRGPTSMAFSLDVANNTISNMGYRGMDEGEENGHHVEDMGMPMMSRPADPLLEFDKDEMIRLCRLHEEEIGIMYPVLNVQSVIAHAKGLASFLDTIRHQNPMELINDEKTLQLKIVMCCGLVVEEHGHSEKAIRLYDSMEMVLNRKLMAEAADVSSLPLLALVAGYRFLSNDEVLAWRVMGQVARLCLELGIHQRSGLIKIQDEDERNNALNSFWSAYVLDRRWAFGTGLPYVVQDEEIDAELPFPDIENLDQEILGWYEIVPEEVKVRNWDKDKNMTSTPSHNLQRLRIWTYLRLNQRNEYHVKSASVHAPVRFSAACREEFYMALELVKDLSARSWASQRLWRTIRSLKDVAPRFGLNPEDDPQSTAALGMIGLARGHVDPRGGQQPFRKPSMVGQQSQAATPDSVAQNGSRIQAEMSRIFEGYVGLNVQFGSNEEQVPASNGDMSASEAAAGIKPPNTLPLVGNGILFLQPRQRLFAWFAKCERLFGYETLHISVPSLPPGVIISDPRNLEFVLRNEGIFEKGDFFKQRSWDLFGHGIINVDGELWKLQRKAGLRFLATPTLRALTSVALPQYLGEAVAGLMKSAGSSEAVDLQAVIHEVTTQLMGRMAYNMDMHTDDDFTVAFEHASGATADRFQNPLWFLTELITGTRMRRSIATIKAYGRRIVDSAVSDRAAVEAKGSRSDMPGSLIQSLLDSIGDETLVADAALNYLSAGRDTVAQALTWTLYLLMKHPGVASTLRNSLTP